MYFLLFAILLILVFKFLLFIYKSYLMLYRFRKVPGPNPRLPIIGNSYVFVRLCPPSNVLNTVIKELNEAYKKDGMALIQYGCNSVLFLFKPEFITQFLSDHSIINKAEEYTTFKAWLGDGLVTANGQKWKQKRKLLNPAFHSKILEDYIPVINEEAFKLIEVLRDSTNYEFIDVRSIINECALSVIIRTALGVSSKECIDFKKYEESVKSVQTSLMSRVYDPRNWSDFMFYNSKFGKDCLNQIHILHNCTRKVIKERKKSLNLSPISYSKRKLSFLDLLLTLQTEEPSITDELIREDVDTFMFAGHDTSASCLIWTLYLLSQNPEKQQKLKNEMLSIFENDNKRDVRSEDLTRMHYAECVIKESLRLYPPVPIIGRIVDSNFNIGGFSFNRGTSVFIAINNAHRDEHLFKNSNEFIPERFQEDTKIDIGFLPFAKGPRNCIGQRFAIIEMKIILAHIFRTFELQFLKGNDIEVSIDLVLKPISPIFISFKELKKTHL